MLCPVLVGRDGEMRHLRGALDAASTGRGRTALLVGEAGIRPTVVLGNQAGPARLSGIAAAAGFTRIREAARTPFNIVLEARP
ncbi:MAG TPA: hypothetical protein VII22_22795 [Streptosporangiaceae bacterium]